jgi:MFS family permease
MGPESVPAFSRRSYRWELTSGVFMPVAIGCLEAGVIGVIAKKAFGAPSLVVAALAAMPALSNLTSALWTRLFHGRDRVRCIVTMQSIVIACVLMVALAPFNAAGQAMLLLGAMLGRFAMAGLMVARTDVWRANYARDVRATATGKLTMVMTASLGLTALLIGVVMDLDAASPAIGEAVRSVMASLGVDAARPEHIYRAFFLAAALVGVIGAWAFSNVRWRGKVAHTNRELAFEGGGKKAAGAKAMLDVLRDDALYRRYMIAQFMLGFPNIAALPLFIIALERGFALAYTPSLVLTQVLPVVLPIVSIPIWARLLDGMHIVRFRVYHSWFFVLANLLMGLGFLMASLPLLVAARVVLGIAFGGGMLAWQLGHHDFARRELASVYMGVHATLTGVRGATAPFVGLLLYKLFIAGEPEPTPDAGAGGAAQAMPSAGGWAFVVLAAAGVWGAMLFLKLHRDLKRGGSASTATD